MKIALKYPIFENLDFHEKEPKTSGFIDFSTSNIQISHADACVRRCVGFLVEKKMTRRAYIPDV